LTNARQSTDRLIGCANSGAVSHCRLIFERLAYTRLVLKKFIVRKRKAGKERKEGGVGKE